MKKLRRILYGMFFLPGLILLGGCGGRDGDTVVLRVSNWEEYIDLGGWSEEEAIVLRDGTKILGENSMVADFENWYLDTYGIRVKVEYSTFGTNEELYNQITIGDVYDLVCPSEYMIMKMLREGMLTPYSAEFYDPSLKENYYIRGVSPYIRGVFEELSVNQMPLSSYAAGYMWGTLGLVYNPEEVTADEAAHWELLWNPNYYRRLTIKDSIRDAYFAALAKCFYDTIQSDAFMNDPNYKQNLTELLNRTDEETVNRVQELLTQAKNNVYSFETDAGKADMVTGKVVANEQWSGDAVYTLNQAEEDGILLCYSAPEEGTNLWFDGWVMLQAGLKEDARKQHAAEAFVNYLSLPENAIRNMSYIGYTSVISGGDSELIFDYIDWNYGAEEEEDSVSYDVGYFFDAAGMDADTPYMIRTTKDQTRRQLYAQYPTKDVVERSVVMACFQDKDNERINRMWTNVRCFDLAGFFR